MSKREKPYTKRAMEEGPLPKVDDDSELVGEDDKLGLPESQDADEADPAEPSDTAGGLSAVFPAPGASTTPAVAVKPPASKPQSRRNKH